MAEITRTPYCTKIRYGITGAPIIDGDEMDGSHAPGVGISPTLIELVYSAPRDGKPATVAASVTGAWTRFGQLDPDGYRGQVETHFKNGPDGWPAWLAAEARLHDPETERCICGHTEPQHFEDACLACDCGDYLPPAADREVIGRYQDAVKRHSVDRAAVYAEVADRLAADAEQGAKGGLTRIYRRSAAEQVRDWGDELRRTAGGTPATTSEAVTPGRAGVFAAAPTDLRARVLREIIGRITDTGTGDSATEEVGAPWVLAVLEDLLAETEQAAAGARQDGAQPEPRRCAHTDVVYGRCILPIPGHLDCFHERQPIRIDEETDEDRLCSADYPGDDNFVGQLCGLPKDHFGDHRCDEAIGAGHTALLRWKNEARP